MQGRTHLCLALAITLFLLTGAGAAYGQPANLGLGIGPVLAQAAAQAQDALAAGTGDDSAAAIDRAITATRTLSRMRSTTQAQRRAAAARAQALAGPAAGAKRSLLGPLNAAAAGIVCNAPTGLANADYLGLCPNWGFSPPLRKFVDSLPGLGAGQQNNLHNYIPIAQAIANPLYPLDDYYEIAAVEYHQQMHSDLPAAGTKLRGYMDLNSATPTARFLGPLIVASRNKAVRVKFSNQLPLGNMFIPVDRTYMGAGFGPDGVHRYTDNRADLHLHGGNTPWISDGTPHQWITPANEISTTYRKGLSFQNVPDMIGPGLTIPSPADNDALGTYYWTNQQSSRLMFYHEHAYGITRTNVYGGLAAGYLLTDDVENGLIDSGVIPGLPRNLATNVYAYGIPLIIQDKTFVWGAPGTGTYLTDPTWPQVVTGSLTGDLWFPHVYMPNQNPSDLSGANAMGRWDYGPWFWPPYTGLQVQPVPCPDPNPLGDQNRLCPATPNPSGVPEAFMDTPIVNGQAYPFVTLPAQATRFRILNATNDRHLNLQLYLADPLTVAITNGGSGYTLPPLVSFANAPGDTTGAGAAGTAVISTGSVTDILLIGGGHSYVTPVVSFTGGGGAGATAIASIASGVISGITVTAGGSGYTSVPAVVITDAGGGVGASATAVITPAGALLGVTVTNPGTGYTLPPLVSFTNAPGDTTGAGAAAITSVNTEVKMTDAVPHPLINAPPGSLPACASPEQTPEQIYLAGNTTGLPRFCYPAAWPTDGRDGGVPNPTTAGPAMVQIGTEGGILPAPVVIPSTPVGYNYNRRDIVVLNVLTKGLFMGPAERADVIVDFTAFANKTLILYNDAPAPVPAFDSRFDYYTGDPDQTLTGGATTTLPGFGPNTRTIMQIRVGAAGTAAPFSLAALKTALPAAFAQTWPLTGDHPIVPEPVYNAVYNPATPYAANWARIQDMKMTFTPIGQTTAPAPIDLQPKAIQELFTVDYGRMNATLGVELPNTNVTTQTTIPLAYIDPPTEVLNDGETQLWKITHNGVDTHAVHFHLFNVQVINRVGWDGAIRPPEANELGWKETVKMSPLEDIIVALRPMKQILPFGIPESQRPLDVTMPIGSTGQFTNIDPLTNNPITVFNQMTNFGWEYVWHCHLLGHEENDMMRPIVFKVQPVAIPSVTASATASPLQVTVNWTYTQNPANPATAFRLLRTTGVTTITLAVITNIAQRSYIDTAVAFSTNYTYRIIAFNATSVSLPSNNAVVTTPGAPPVRLATPLNLAAPLKTTTTVTLTWSVVSGATRYIVEQSNNGGVTWTQIGTPSVPSLRVTGLTTQTNYQFRVSASNGNPATQSLPTAPLLVRTN